MENHVVSTIKKIMLLLLFITVFALCAHNAVLAAPEDGTQSTTRVTISGSNEDTVISLRKIDDNKIYTGILDGGGEVIFKNLPYGTYEVSCINLLDVKFVEKENKGNQFTLSETNATVNLEVENQKVSKSGFYCIEQKNNIFYWDTTPPDIEGEDITVKLGEETTIYNGLTAMDNHDGDITNKIITTDIFDETIIGPQLITYTVKDSYGNETAFQRTITVTTDYEYTGTYSKFVAPKDGNYIFELWGASGKEGSIYIGAPGHGAYTKGAITLTKGQVLYLYIGQSGDDVSVPSELSFNGGGETHGFSSQYGKGGGATDIRLVPGDWKDDIGLNSRIMVAGGGGSGQGNVSGSGGDAGGLEGFIGSNPNSTLTKSTQTSGYKFGYGNGGYSGKSWSGGGGGYYGGDASMQGAMTTYGGSSFISGYPGCDAIKGEGNREHTGQPNHYSGLVFFNTIMKAGNEEMPAARKEETTIGNLGDGYIKVNYIEQDPVPPIITLLGGESITVNYGSGYVEPGYTVMDNIDGDITANVIVSDIDVSTIGTKTITYSATDSSGNTVTATRTVHVSDIEAPIIAGGDYTTYIGNENLLFSGLTITDNYDTDIESRVVVTGEIDVTKVGTYTLTYNVTDSNGNIGTPLVRNITITDRLFYTGSSQKFVAPIEGDYQIELWGASRKRVPSRKYRSTRSWSIYERNNSFNERSSIISIYRTKWRRCIITNTALV